LKNFVHIVLWTFDDKNPGKFTKITWETLETLEFEFKILTASPIATPPKKKSLEIMYLYCIFSKNCCIFKF